jgi:beta-lactam-binding protein with PASTA domain
VRSDEEMRDSNSRTSGIASEATIPAVNQHDGTINNENTINKITITFYQKRTNKKH